MKTFKYKNEKIYYEIHGNSDEVLLILNGIMMSTDSWHQFLPELTKYHKVILIDFIDQGKSISYKNNYNYKEQTNMLNDFINFLKIDKLNIAAISYGGQIALDYAINNSNKINNLILFNTTLKTTSWMKEVYDLWLEAGKINNHVIYYKATIPTIYSQTFFETNLKWMKEREEILFEVFKNPVFINRMNRLINSVYNFDVSNLVKNIKTNTLIVASNEDYLTPVKLQKDIQKQIINSKIKILQNVGHASMYENPEEFTNIIINFINNKDDNK